MTLPTNCPLCHANEKLQSVITTHVFGDTDCRRAFFKCHACDVIYLFPQLTKEEEHAFYVKEFEEFMGARSGENAGWESPEKHIKANQSQFQRRLEYLKNYLPQKGKILEFGCSSGFMLLPLIEKGYDCYGIEPSGCFSDYIQLNGITIFEDSKLAKEQFDIVMHYFVLEHVRNPIDFIDSNLRLLKPGGKLIIEIPNAADPLYTLYNISEFEKFYWSIAHHWYFTELSVSYILEKFRNISYKILRDQRYDLSNHLIWAKDGKPGGMGRFSKTFGTKLDCFYKEALIESGHCDTLILIINKKASS